MNNNKREKIYLESNDVYPIYSFMKNNCHEGYIELTEEECAEYEEINDKWWEWQNRFDKASNETTNTTTAIGESDERN